MKKNLLFFAGFISTIIIINIISYNKNVAPEYIDYAGSLVFTPSSMRYFESELKTHSNAPISFNKKNGVEYYNMMEAFSELMSNKHPYIIIKPYKESVMDHEKLEYYKDLYGMGNDGEICKIIFNNKDVRETSLYKVGYFRLLKIEDGSFHYSVENCTLIK